MKKFAVLIGIVAIIILATVPLLIGLVIDDSTTAARLREISGQPGLTVNTRAAWFSSVGTLQLDAPIIAGERYDQVRIEADLRIIHGPILLTEQGLRLGLAWVEITPLLRGVEQSPLLLSLFREQDGAQIALMASFDGALHAQLRSGPLEFTEEGRHFDFEDLQVALDIARSGTATVQLATSSVNISDALFAATLNALEIELHSASLDASPLPGSLSIAAETAEFSGWQGLTLGGIRIDYAAREQPGVDGAPPSLLLQQSIELARLESELPLTALSMQTQLEGLDLALVADYLRVLRNLSLHDPATTPEQLEAVLVEMLKESFTQSSHLRATAWGGEHQADLEIIWPGEPTLLTMEQLTFGRVVGLLDADLTINANEQALMQSMFAASVRTYTAQGVLPQNNGDVVITATLQGADLILNGQHIQLAPFLNIGYTGTP